jgi:penicillin-binding protein 2
LVFFILLLILLVIRLFVITGIQGEKWTAEAETNTVKSIYTDAPRGEIYDRNGVLLAGNLPSFTVTFSRNAMTGDETNASISGLIAILERHGETLLDDFPIVLTDGAFSYTFDAEIADWLETQQMPADFTAEQAFNEIRRRNNIEEGLDRFDAQEKLLEQGISPPISVQQMEFTSAREKKNFLKQFNIDGNPDADKAFADIRKYYNIDKGLTDEEARKILTIRNDLTAQGYLRYLPTKVSTGIKQETVLEIEERAHDLEGVAVITESVRYYPQGNHASHVLGYMGKISDEKKQEYVDEQGYQPTDLIGLDGIEASKEDILHGTDGVKQIQVNSAGELIRTIGEETTAKNGKDVVLTIDLRLQEIAEDALKRTIDGIRNNKDFESKYGTYKFTDSAHAAEIGAVVMLDVKTGEPLAIASYPDFDPNLFAEGISQADWNALQSTNPRDPLSPRPLYNVAARTAVQPGSTFKPMTAIAALESGLNANRYLYDAKYIEIGDHVYSCMGSHGNVNLFTALQYSCNYYFFDVAAGRDWAKGGADLGYADNISIDKIMEYAKQFGLGVKSGAEISETIIDAPNAAKKLSSTQTLLLNYLTGQAEYIFSDEILKDHSRLTANIEEIVSWMAENPKLAEIKSRMLDLGIKESEATRVAEECKYTYFNYAEWTVGDTLNIAIGQGENAFTPLQMANYFATLGNGGVRNSLSLIKAVEDEGEVTRPAGQSADISNPQNLKDVIAGLRRVVTSGSLGRGLSGLPVEAVGKTGTAQRSGYVNPPDEVAYVKEHLSKINAKLNWADVEAEMQRLMKEYPRIYDNPNTAVRRAVVNLSGSNFNAERIDAYKSTYEDFAWSVAMAPADDPQVVVVSLIVQGGSSSNAAPPVRELLGRYFELKAEDAAKGGSIDYTEFFNEDHRNDGTDTSGDAIATAGAVSGNTDGGQ